MRLLRNQVSSLSLRLLMFFACAKYSACSDWCYEDTECDPYHWAGSCKTGKSQSPIDFNTTLLRSQERIINRRLRFDTDYLKAYENFYILNNGHTVQIQLERNPTSQCHVDGAGLRGSYVFAQMHFHWGRTSATGSEHTVDGRHYPIEVHFVHYSDRYDSLTDALQDNNRRAVAVLGFFFQVVPGDNPALSSIIDALALVQKPDKDIKAAQGKLNLTALLPSHMSLWRYDGSLTTPSCAEKVIWSVLRSPVGISEKQLEAFRDLLDGHGKPMVNNFRPVQPLVRRPIKFYEIDRFDIKSDDEHNEIDEMNVDESELFSTVNPPTHGHGIDHEAPGPSSAPGGHSKKPGDSNGGGHRSSGPASSMPILSLILLFASALLLCQHER